MNCDSEWPVISCSVHFSSELKLVTFTFLGTQDTAIHYTCQLVVRNAEFFFLCVRRNNFQAGIETGSSREYPTKMNLGHLEKNNAFCSLNRLL